MQGAFFYVSGLLGLGQVRSPEERRATFRQSMAALAKAVLADEGPGPLEGVNPTLLAGGVGAALQWGLVDELAFLAPPAAGIALLELASALPLGPERRELGRRVLSRLMDGNAETFAAIATRMAKTTGKGLSTPGVRARITLLTELPFSAGVADGALALALASRRELAREWIELPSTGSLPSRRLSARLLERAAREASRRAQQGDPHALRAFRAPPVQKAWDRLLADRESLVWRHVAAARGLLAPWDEMHQAALNRGLDPSLGPTEWRRAATSIAAETAVDPNTALRLAAAALARGAVARDSGVAVAFVWGAARAAEAEPDAAADLVGEAVAKAPGVVAEAVLELAEELGPCRLVEESTALAVAALRGAPESERVETALTRELLRDLDRTPRDDEPLRQQLRRALDAFAGEGARSAHAEGKRVLVAATGAMDALASVGPEDESAEGRSGLLAMRTSMAVLRDLDLAVLERDVLGALLALGASSEAERNEEGVDALRGRLTEWLLLRESHTSGDSARGVTLPLRRLRSLLHLVDSDVLDANEDGARAARLRDRWRLVARTLLPRYEAEAGSPLHRALSATLMRALDALVRVGALDPADVLFLVTRLQTEPPAVETLVEASMDPDVVHVLSRYAAFLRTAGASADAAPDSLLPSGVPPRRAIQALAELARDVAPDAAGRREVLRSVLVRLVASLEELDRTSSLRALSPRADHEPDCVLALEAAVTALANAASGARTRLSPASLPEAVPAPTSEKALSLAVTRVLTGADSKLDEKLVGDWMAALEQRIPAGLAHAIGSIASCVLEKPAERPSGPVVQMVQREAQLPAWLPARRTLGGFYVVRPLGSGAAGSVFLARRIEDRHDPSAEPFALKVPDYSATAARSLSEVEFLRLFRDEASALMAVPAHPNLARFVTFDLAARPKPILVMELVEGSVLERVIEAGALDAGRALVILDGVLAGLEAMHGVGVGHLDLKPGNVILRRGDEAVLVDFGLAGRHVRPGCTTGPYGAPEVWGVFPEGTTPSPLKADIYAFGCLAFETMTGRLLFDAASETAQIGMHLAHDGLPPALGDLGKREHCTALVSLLSSTLRRDPSARPTAAAVRAGLASLRAALSRQAWPLAV